MSTPENEQLHDQADQAGDAQEPIVLEMTVDAAALGSEEEMTPEARLAHLETKVSNLQNIVLAQGQALKLLQETLLNNIQQHNLLADAHNKLTNAFNDLHNNPGFIKALFEQMDSLWQTTQTNIENLQMESLARSFVLSDEPGELYTYKVFYVEDFVGGEGEDTAVEYKLSVSKRDENGEYHLVKDEPSDQEQILFGAMLKKLLDAGVKPDDARYLRGKTQEEIAAETPPVPDINEIQGQLAEAYEAEQAEAGAGEENTGQYSVTLHLQNVPFLDEELTRDCVFATIHEDQDNPGHIEVNALGWNGTDAWEKIEDPNLIELYTSRLEEHGAKVGDAWYLKHV